MHKITLISLSTPTFNNVRAASALPFHLIKGGEGVSLVYSFNINNVDGEGIARSEQELGVKMQLLARPRWQRWMFKLRLLVLRVLLRRPLMAYFSLPQDVVDEINASDCDTVWIYGEELARMARMFPGKRVIVTMPDCESMYYHRLLHMNFATRKLRQVLRYAFAYWQYRHMETTDFTPDVRYHFVGEADARFYSEINPDADVVFLPHPLYVGESLRTGPIAFHQPRIRLLVAVRYDIYMREACDAVFAAMTSGENAQFVADNYEVTFLGRDWEAWCERFAQCGITARVKTFVNDYHAELQEHDVELSPISVGTGTKGKVLDALANGLLVVGTPFALENIAVENGVSCYLYHCPEEAIEALRAIAGDVAAHEAMARRSMQAVYSHHSRVKIARELFV